jgi:hypothetical protein
MEIILFFTLFLIGLVVVTWVIGSADCDTIVTRAALRQGRQSDRV